MSVTDIIKHAGDIIMHIYNTDFSSEQKDDKSPVTQADIKADAYITEALKDYPYALLTEEQEDSKERLGSEHVWIIDPLDGTKEFISKNGEFTVNIALVRNNRPIKAWIYVPAKDLLFTAEYGKGAFLNGEQVHVSSRNMIQDMILTRSRSHASDQVKKLSEKFADAIPSGSSMKGCKVAKGEADVYFRFGPVHEWDICAMDLIVHEAGGIMTDMQGIPLKYNQEDTLVRGFVASNNTIHKSLIRLAKEVNT